MSDATVSDTAQHDKPSARPCPSYPGYSASPDGRVFSNLRVIYGYGGKRGRKAVIDPTFFRELKPFVGKRGYLKVTCRIGGKERTGAVHKMVLDAFVGPCPEGMECRHLDGNPANNRLKNLAYGTPKQNADDRMRHGHYARGEQHQNAKLTEEQVREIKAAPRRYGLCVEFAKRFGVSRDCVRTARSRHGWRHIGVQREMT